MIKVGIIGEVKDKVSENNTAKTLRSGELNVYATPSMVALMEEAACAAVNAYLEAGSGTVGISLNITHDRATAMNDTVKATATLTAVEGRKLVFSVQAEDSKGIIGKGSHERFIINNEKFMAKVTA